MISKKELLDRLKKQISDRERVLLSDGGRELVISKYNLETVLRLLSFRETSLMPDGSFPDPGIEPCSVEGLEAALTSYLERYMADQPQGHKWILLSCLFLTFIAEEPMHPHQIVHWVKDRGAFVCPARDVSADSLCHWCVCRSRQ